MEGFCRGCLNKFDEPTDLIQYCESNRRLFVYSTGLQVKRNDAFTFQLCKECYLNMRLSCKFKKQCRNSDKKFKNYLAYKDEHVDFCTYLKNVEDSLPLKLPKLISGSTPNRQKITDDDVDDNESTCTSIQNFMTDMLEGEEMPPTEDHIIREVIQEEADILDDSLDSHWLEDMSVDFGMDINFGGFSTPHTIVNDHCYTPRRIADDTDEQINYFTSKKSIKTNIDQQNDMPVLENCDIKFNRIDDENNIPMVHLEAKYFIENGTDLGQPNAAQNNDMPVLDDCNIEFDGVVDETITVENLEGAFCTKHIKDTGKNLILPRRQAKKDDAVVKKKVKEFAVEDNLFSISNVLSPFLNSDTIIKEEITQPVLSNDNDISIIVSKGIAGEKRIDSRLTCELEYYMTKGNVNITNNNKTSENHGSIVNKKDFHRVSNQTEGSKTIDRSPFTQELEKYINEVKTNKTLETKSTDPVLNIFNGDPNSMTDLNNSCRKFIEDSPVKCELEHYINKAELKKKSYPIKTQNKPNGNNAKDSIDKNLELALINQDNHEFSLDQLLLSPQVNTRSGASTPTINNILFGAMTPKNKYTSIGPVLNTEIIQDPNLKQLKEELSKDGGFKNLSTPKKCQDNNESKLKVKNIKTLKEPGKNKNAIRFKTRGFKDIKQLKQIFIFDNDDQNSEMSEDEDPDSVQNDKNDKTDPQAIHEFEDINVSNLLNFDDCQSIDLNLSICSDFLKDTENLNHSDSECELGSFSPTTEDVANLDADYKDPFKRPFTPPPVNYDIENMFKRPFTPPPVNYDLEKCICKICNNKYKSRSLLRKHFATIHKFTIPRTRNGNKYYKKICCDLCGKTYRSKTSLNRHLKDHEVQKKLQCHLCLLRFTTPGKLSQHMRAHAHELHSEEIELRNNKDQNNKYLCNTCGHAFTRLSNYKVHLRRHTKSYTVRCEQCGKGFYKQVDLRQHEMTHIGMGLFHCEYCPKTYKRRDSLMQHNYRHLNKAGFKCDVCGANFVSKHKLKIHYTTLTCKKNRNALAKKAIEDTVLDPVECIHVVGSQNKINKLMESTVSKMVTCDIEIKDEIKMTLPDTESPMKMEMNVENSEIKEDFKTGTLETIAIVPELCLEITDVKSMAVEMDLDQFN